MKGMIFDIKEMAVHDGPGIRTTVFLKGCPLRCVWCHNPEGLSAVPQLMYKEARCLKCDLCKTTCDHSECQPYGRCINICPMNCMEIVGREVESSELADVLRRSADVLGNSFGGFTFSGGEPLMQSDFILEVIAYLSGYHFCIETSGYASANVFSKILDKIDYVIMDLKLADDSMHKQFTGVSNERILKNFDTLRKSGKECCIRTPLIPSITDTEKNLSEIKALVGDIHHELLPYNPIGAAKYKMLNMSYPMNEFIVN